MPKIIISREQLAAAKTSPIKQLNESGWVDPESKQHTYLKDYKRHTLELCHEKAGQRTDDNNELELQFNAALQQDNFSEDEKTLLKKYYSQNLCSVNCAFLTDAVATQKLCLAGTWAEGNDHYRILVSKKEIKGQNIIVAEGEYWGFQAYPLDDDNQLDVANVIPIFGKMKTVYYLTTQGFALQHIEVDNQNLANLLINKAPTDERCAILRQHDDALAYLHEQASQPHHHYLQQHIQNTINRIASHKKALDATAHNYHFNINALTARASAVSAAIEMPYHLPTLQRLEKIANKLPSDQNNIQQIQTLLVEQVLNRSIENLETFLNECSINSTLRSSIASLMTTTSNEESIRQTIELNKIIHAVISAIKSPYHLPALSLLQQKAQEQSALAPTCNEILLHIVDDEYNNMLIALQFLEASLTDKSLKQHLSDVRTIISNKKNELSNQTETYVNHVHALTTTINAIILAVKAPRHQPALQQLQAQATQFELYVDPLQKILNCMIIAEYNRAISQFTLVDNSDNALTTYIAEVMKEIEEIKTSLGHVNADNIWQLNKLTLRADALLGVIERLPSTTKNKVKIAVTEAYDLAISELNALSTLHPAETSLSAHIHTVVTEIEAENITLNNSDPNYSQQVAVLNTKTYAAIFALELPLHKPTLARLQRVAKQHAPSKLNHALLALGCFLLVSACVVAAVMSLGALALPSFIAAKIALSMACTAVSISTGSSASLVGSISTYQSNKKTALQSLSTEIGLFSAKDKSTQADPNADNLTDNSPFNQ